MTRRSTHQGTDRNATGQARTIDPAARGLRALLPGAMHEASLAAARTGPRPVSGRPRGGICRKCGTQSVRHVVDGLCDDQAACAAREESWR